MLRPIPRNVKRNDVYERLKEFMMKKRYIIGMFIGSVLFCSCAKDAALGPDVSLERDYVLPQGKSPQADGFVREVWFLFLV